MTQTVSDGRKCTCRDGSRIVKSPIRGAEFARPTSLEVHASEEEPQCGESMTRLRIIHSGDWLYFFQVCHQGSRVQDFRVAARHAGSGTVEDHGMYRQLRCYCQGDLRQDILLRPGHGFLFLNYPAAYDTNPVEGLRRPYSLNKTRGQTVAGYWN